MKKSIICYLIMFSAAFCMCKKASAPHNVDSAKTISDEFDVAGVDTAAFDFLRYHDTTYYYHKSVIGIEGHDIYFNSDRYKDVQVRVKFTLMFTQYISEYSPAIPLHFRKETAWIDLKVKDGIIEIPELTDKTDHVDLANLLGFNNYHHHAQSLFNANKTQIKAESLSLQIQWLEHTLKSPDANPEFIRRYKEIVTNPPGRFNTLEDLNIELKYSRLIIDIHAKAGREAFNIHKVIIGAQSTYHPI